MPPIRERIVLQHDDRPYSPPRQRERAEDLPNHSRAPALESERIPLAPDDDIPAGPASVAEHSSSFSPHDPLDIHHCGKCHKTFLGWQDGPTSCTVHHIPPPYPLETAIPAPLAYPCCGKWLGEKYPDGRSDDGICYRGSHTRTTLEDKCESCIERGCFYFYCVAIAKKLPIAPRER